jgi:Reverse transcriptase (RNA-dependent DNA polymerase).
MREGRFYMDQSVKLKLDQEERRSAKNGRWVTQGYCLSPIPFNLYGECFTKETLERFGDFKVWGKAGVLRSVKYADYFLLLAKEETVLQDIIDILIEAGRSYGMEIHVEETKVMRI